MNGRRFAVLTLAVAGALLLSVGCGDDGDSDTETIKLVGPGNDFTKIDNGKPGPSEGDVVVFDSVMTLADGGESVGHLFGTQTTVSLDDQIETVQASFTYQLKDGTVSIGGLSQFNKGDTGLIQDQEFVRPIIGGTGKYSGASGTDTTSLNTDGQYEHQLQFED